MLSKNQIKFITSLQQKKYRFQNGLFIAEGVKVVNELINSSFELEKLYCTEDHGLSLANYKPEILTEKELLKISGLSTPNKVLGLFKIPVASNIKMEGLLLALDDINDPGNLGTIIRLCDWFGVQYLICSKNTVDCYNPKVVQATMGSLTRVHISYVDLDKFLNETSLNIYGATMDGENLGSVSLEKNAIIVMGNESHGLSKGIEALLTKKITIPKFSKSKDIDSLNVATATAIILNELRRT
ncbi:MAG: RNA methyltransferase [Bacteroidia bacterium]|nr:RNA methyltransferase [Bacteroidia bacterium]